MPPCPVRAGPPPVNGRPPGLLVFAQLGLVAAFILLGLGALGWGLDSLLGTLPLFMLVGLLAGAVAGSAYTWREVKRLL